jgi:hypothetical protein
MKKKDKLELLRILDQMTIRELRILDQQLALRICVWEEERMNWKDWCPNCHHLTCQRWIGCDEE